MTKEKTLIKCECGEMVNESYIKAHRTSKRHNDLINGVKVPVYTPTKNGKVKCECGGKFYYSSSSRNTHEKTETHISYMNTPVGSEYVRYVPMCMGISNIVKVKEYEIKK